MIEISYTIDKRDSHDRILINAWHDDIEIAEFMCQVTLYCKNCEPPYCHCSPKSEVKKLWIMRKGIQVKEEFRGQKVSPRISHTIYRVAECHFRLRIMPDGKTTEDGKRFRKNYERIYGSWKNEFEEKSSDCLLPPAKHISMRKIT
jgi:hypothetical protein